MRPLLFTDSGRFSFPMTHLTLEQLDHLVLTVRDIEATCRFYENVLGMTRVTFAGGRTALQFANQKINLHRSGHEFEPKAAQPGPGTADLCFITHTPLSAVLAHLAQHDIPLVAGPVPRTGARGPITSVYVRDPDGNLLELANPNYHSPT
jgi:catechol 2,3-dioxygenase-like lactoylglutathione lyase family enzyme